MISSKLVYVLALFFNLFSNTATIALPTGRTEEDNLGFNAVLGEDVVNAAGPIALFSRRYPVIEGVVDEDETKRIFTVLDLGSKGSSGIDVRPTLDRAFPMLSPWREDHTPAITWEDELQKSDDVMSMVKRDKENKCDCNNDLVQKQHPGKNESLMSKDAQRISSFLTNACKNYV